MLATITRLKGKPLFVMSKETQAIVEVLRGVNQEISYPHLSAAVGIAVTGNTPALASARRHLESAEGIVFDVVRGQGLVRLDDVGKVASTARHARSISRAARRGKKRIGSIENFAALPNDAQLQATLRATQFEFAHQAVSSKKLDDPSKLAGKLDIKGLMSRIKK